MGTESPPAMKSLDMLIFLLVLWGLILNLICLFILPLFVGMCGPFNNFIPYVACTDGAPITLELRLACYLFGTCGLVRMLSGLFPDQGAVDGWDGNYGARDWIDYSAGPKRGGTPRSSPSRWSLWGDTAVYADEHAA